MPNAATHVLAALISADVIRDYFAKKRFSLFFVVVAGIAGLFPDIDVLIYWAVNLFREVPLNLVHRYFTHTLFIPLIFFLVALLFRKKKGAFLLFSMAALGSFVHLVLDITLSGTVMPFYPFINFSFGLQLIPAGQMGSTIIAGLDAFLLVGWIVHEFMKHKIKDFI